MCVDHTIVLIIPLPARVEEASVSQCLYHTCLNLRGLLTMSYLNPLGSRNWGLFYVSDLMDSFWEVFSELT